MSCTLYGDGIHDDRLASERRNRSRGQETVRGRQKSGAVKKDGE